MQKCVARLSRASTGKWSVGAAEAATRTVDEAAAELAAVAPGLAVCFEVAGDLPFSCMVAFRPEDAEIISHGFLGFSYTRIATAKELLFSEVGNIIANAFISAVSAELDRTFLPSVPRCMAGEPEFLLEAIWAGHGGQPRGVIMVALELKCDGKSARSLVAAVIPEKLEKSLSAAGRS